MGKPEYIAASEIGEYLYCRRAWWYKRIGLASGAGDALLRGRVAHDALYKRVAGVDRVIALTRALLLAGLLVLLMLVVAKLVLGW